MATAAGLRQTVVRGGRLRGRSADALFESGDLLADGHRVVHHGSLDDLLHVVHVEGARAYARRNILGAVRRATALGALGERGDRCRAAPRPPYASTMNATVLIRLLTIAS